MVSENEDFFDYEFKDEYDEDLDFTNLRPCPHCKKPIPQNAISCLYCGESLSFSKKPTWIILVVIIVIIAFIFLILL